MSSPWRETFYCRANVQKTNSLLPAQNTKLWRGAISGEDAFTAPCRICDTAGQPPD